LNCTVPSNLLLANAVYKSSKVKFNMQSLTAKMAEEDQDEGVALQTRLRKKGLFKEKRFEFRVKLMRGYGI